MSRNSMQMKRNQGIQNTVVHYRNKYNKGIHCKRIIYRKIITPIKKINRIYNRKQLNRKICDKKYFDRKIYDRKIYDRKDFDRKLNDRIVFRKSQIIKSTDSACITASFTVEAALLLPTVFSVLLTFVFFFFILMAQDELHSAASNTCEYFAERGYLMRAAMNLKKQKEEAIEETREEVLEETREDSEALTQGKELLSKVKDLIFIKTAVTQQVQSFASIDRVVTGGFDGIVFLGSDLFTQDKKVVIQMSYQINWPFFQNILPQFIVVQRVCMNSFYGHDLPVKSANSSEKIDEIVYIAKTGNVYHTHRDCTHIQISLESVLYAVLSSRRNQNGGKYYPCEACCEEENGQQLVNVRFFITNNGTRYHSLSSCSKITRSVSTVKKSEVIDKGICKKCQERDGKEE